MSQGQAEILAQITTAIKDLKIPKVNYPLKIQSGAITINYTLLIVNFIGIKRDTWKII